MSEQEHEELRASSPNSAGPQTAAGDMGVSSERIGHTGPGQVGTDGQKDTSPRHSPKHRKGDEDTPPEQSPGNVEENPVGIPPKAGYSSKDPRSDDEV